jgi:hypothetical protein
MRANRLFSVVLVCRASDPRRLFYALGIWSKYPVVANRKHRGELFGTPVDVAVVMEHENDLVK